MSRAPKRSRSFALPAVLTALSLLAAGAASHPADARESSTEESAVVPAEVLAVEVDGVYAARFGSRDAAALRTAGVNTVLVDVRRVGARRAGRLARVARAAKLIYLPIVATVNRSSASGVRAACAAYRRAAAIRQCAVATSDVRIAASVARRGGADAVVVRLAGPGALPAVPAGTARTHVVAVAIASAGKSAAVWQFAIGRARATRYLGLGAAPARARHADALRAYLDLVRRGTTSSAPRPPAAPGPPASGTADLFVSPGGSDGGRCSQATPCASFDRAYDVAAPGDVVEVGPGTYRGQEINGAPKPGGPSIVFRPARDASVIVHDLEVARGSQIEFRDLTVSADTYNLPGAQHITYRRIKMRQFFIRGADHINYVDSDVGPNVSNDGMNWITAAYQTNDGASDILLDRVRIHDFKKWNSGAHVDCIGIDDVDGLTIRQSRIWNCEHFSLIFGKDLWSGRAARNILIENSFIDCCYSGYYSIGLGDIEGPMVIRFNSLTLGLGWLGGSVRSVTLNSNVIATNNQANCSKATWRHNVVRSGGACGGLRAGTGFKSPPHDLHLVSGAAAIGAGDPTSHPATDIDGDARPKGARPDAGADEN
jgi:hypothetical protein